MAGSIARTMASHTEADRDAPRADGEHDARCLCAKDIAAELSVGTGTALIELKSMPGVFQVGKRWRITRRDFDVWLADRQRRAEWQRQPIRLQAPAPWRSAPSPATSSWIRPILPRTKPRGKAEDHHDWSRPTQPGTKPRPSK